MWDFIGKAALFRTHSKGSFWINFLRLFFSWIFIWLKYLTTPDHLLATVQRYLDFIKSQTMSSCDPHRKTAMESAVWTGILHDIRDGFFHQYHLWYCSHQLSPINNKQCGQWIDTKYCAMCSVTWLNKYKWFISLCFQIVVVVFLK